MVDNTEACTFKPRVDALGWLSLKVAVTGKWLRLKLLGARLAVSIFVEQTAFISMLPVLDEARICRVRHGVGGSREAKFLRRFFPGNRCS